MNVPTTAAQWLELQTKLKLKFPKLTEADLEYKETQEQDMLRMVEYKTRKTKEEMTETIEGL